MRNWKK